MMHAILVEGSPVLLARTTYTSGNVNYSAGTLDVMPREDKLAFGVYEVVPVTVDNSTGPDTVEDGPPVYAIEADHVSATRTVRDRTAQEIETELSGRADNLSDQDFGKALLSVFRIMYGIAQQINPAITPQQFLAFVNNESASTDIPAEGFKTWLKERL